MKRNLVSCFYLLNMFDIKVPVGYEHKAQLGDFFFSSKGKAGKYRQYEDELTDKNFFNVTNQLIPGKTYVVKIFVIKDDVSSEECLTLLLSQKAALVGAQGLVLLWKLYRNKLPDDKNILSFDVKQGLWKDVFSRHRLPYLSMEIDGGWMLHLANFEDNWGKINCFVCFCEK